MGALHLPKQSEQLFHLLQPDSLACVAYFHLQLLLIVVVGSLNVDMAFVSEFERVFSEVYEDLLQPDLVAN